MRTLRPIEWPSRRSMWRNTAAGKWTFQMQRVDPAHQCQVGFADFLRPIISGRARQRQHLTLPGNRRIAHTVCHLFALSNPALLSPPLKKSISSACCPIFACSTRQTLPWPAPAVAASIPSPGSGKPHTVARSQSGFYPHAMPPAAL